MTLRRIDPTQYATAADAFDAVSASAEQMLASARSALAGYARMAGDDPGGEQFATNYDSLAGAALQAFADISARATMLDRALMASGASHADADGALAGSPGAAAGFPLRPAQVQYCVAPPPSAFGGDAGSTPGPWDLVKDLVGMMWPNADVGKLKQASSTWTTISGDFTALARRISQSDDAVSGLSSAELSRVNTAVADFSSDVTETAEYVADIAEMCTEYADAVEEAHNEVIEMLAQLAIEIAATVGVSVALSFVTFGGAGVVGAAAAAARIASVAVRVGAAISRVLGIAGRIAARLILLYARFVAFAARHAKAAGMAIKVASGGSGAAIAERVVKGAAGSPLVAFGGGIVGGAVSLRIAARFSGLGSTVVREALAEGGGGVASGITSGLMSGNGIDARSVLINGAGGALFGGVFSRVGRRGDVPGTAPDGTSPHVPDHDAPDIAGSDGPTVGAGDGPGTRPDYEGPQIGGSDLVGSGDGGSGIRVPDGEAPTATDVDVSPPVHGGDAPSVNGGGDAPTVNGGDAPTVHGGDAPTVNGGDAPTANGGDAPTVNGGDAPTAKGGDAPTANGGDAPTANGGDAPTANGGDVPDAGDAPTANGGDGPDAGDAPAPADSDAPDAGDAAPGSQTEAPDAATSSPAGTLPGSHGGDAPADASAASSLDDISRQLDELDADLDRKFDELEANIEREFDELQADIDREFDDIQADIDGIGAEGHGDAGTVDGVETPDGAGAADAVPERMSDQDFEGLSPSEQYDVASVEIAHGARTFADNAEGLQYGRDQWVGVADTLDPEVRASMTDYTREVPASGGVTYRDINGALRAGPPYPAEVAPHIQRIDEAMAARPLTEDVIVTRATDIDHWGAPAQDVAGRTFDESSYLSTSLGEVADAFKNKDAILHLRVPEGTPAMWVEAVSVYGSTERELLLGRGLRWLATRSVQIDGKWHVFGEVVV